VRLGNIQLRNFIRFVVAAESVIIITLAIMVIYYGRFPDVRLLFLVLTVLIYWISYKSVSKPDFFLERDSAPLLKLDPVRNTKYAHSSLREEESERIQKELLRLMQADKLFLDADLTIDSLADRIKTSRHHLSQVMNEKLNKSYLDYICDLRLQEACRRLGDRSNLRFTIAAIALDSGFSSVSNFNDVFKKRYGVTPSGFRDQQMKQMSA
jgi:AraC-like DNA-binding protein